MRTCITILGATSIIAGGLATSLDGAPYAQPNSSTQAKAPALSDVTVLSSKTEPVFIKFAIKLSPVQGSAPFGKRAGLWFCFGTPKTVSSLRAELEKELKEDGDRFFLNMRGPGFVAATCSDVKRHPNKPDVWTGTIDLGKAEIQDGQIAIPSSFGPTYFKITEMPISWVYYDDEHRLSNELKALVDLKAGKVVKVVNEQNAK